MYQYKVLFLDTVFSSYEVPTSRFTCTASSHISVDETCKNLYSKQKLYATDIGGWITEGDGIGSWVKIEFHGNIQISKIVYRHNALKPNYCCNQNFKDVSFGFSDGTILNVTLPDVFDKDFSFKINPPKLSSYLYLNAVSVHYHPEQDNDEYSVVYYDNRYGIDKIRLFGSIEKGAPFRDILKYS